MGFNRPISIILRKNKENSKDLLGKTGLYDPNEHKIILYVSGRHPKDILRTLSHELIHHTQNCNGKFLPKIEGESENVKDNEHIKELEKEAYERGNIIFREWEEHIKENDLKTLEEFNAMGTGAVVGYMAPLGMDMTPAHKVMHSGDKPIKKKKSIKEEVEIEDDGIGEAPLFVDDKEGLKKIHDEMQSGDKEIPLEEEYIGKDKFGVRYFQMGGGIKNKALYNRDNKTGKPTRKPGVPNIKK
jgi:hypothetical protein